jgi:hypothetical protein
MGYDAFISYSHAADQRLAAALERALEGSRARGINGAPLSRLRRPVPGACHADVDAGHRHRSGRETILPLRGPGRINSGRDTQDERAPMCRVS